MMSPRPFTLGLAAALLSTSMVANPVKAADLDPALDLPPAPPIAESKVEFGTGWYIRGDIGATRLPSLNVGAPSTLPTVGNQLPPAPPRAWLSSGSDVGYDASLGAGYQVNNWIRTDALFDFHQPLTTTGNSGNGNVFCTTGVSYPNETINGGATNYGAPSYANGGCTGNYRAAVRSYDVMLNGYVDLGTWWRVTPYVGAGVGLSFGHYQTSAAYVQANGVPYQVTYTDPQYGSVYQNFDRQASGTYYNFAYAFMAGVAIDVYDHTKLDIGYRYLNLGGIPGMSGTLSQQEVRAGLRYMIDN